jgi:hypothetical protein
MDNRINKADDGRVDALIREWKSPPPGASFEAAVWRRIRASPRVQPAWIRVLEALRDSFAPQPVWVPAMVVLAAVLLGTGVGFLSSGTDRHHLVSEPLLESRTLAGAYLAMSTGGVR